MNEPCSLPKKLPMTRLLHLLGLVAVLAALCPWTAPPAAAQPVQLAGARNPDNPQISAEIGYGGVIWPNRWVPLTVTLTGGAKAFDGILTITYTQDERSSSQIMRPVAATPGKASSFQTLVNLPPATSQVLLTLQSRSGRNAGRLTLTTLPDPTRNQAFLPAVSGLSPTVVALGAASHPALSTVRSMLDQEDRRHAIGPITPVIAYTPAAQAPASWAALDGVLLLVTTGETAQSCDPRALMAVREWVSAGGRLVVLASEPGEAWRTWLSPSPESPVPVVLGPPRTSAMPAELAGALAIRPVQSPSAPVGSTVDPGTPGTTPATPPTPDIDERFTSAGQLTCRPLSLAPAAAARGWSLRYPIDDSATEACIAEGPHGLGWVVIVGFDPQLIATPVTTEATRRVWHDLLNNALADFRNRKGLPFNPNMAWMQDQFSKGGLAVSDANAHTARNASLNYLSNVPSVGHAVFPVLAVGMFVLAMLIGPVDALLLRSFKARHRSWITALAWISLASAAAYVVPDLIRSGSTIVNRLVIIDAEQTTPDPATAAAPAWRTGLTGVFAGSSIYKTFDGAIEGSWWKSTATEPEFYWGQSEGGRPRRSLPTFQVMPDLTTVARSDDPWGGVGPHDGAGGNIPGPSTFPLWTFRTFQDQGRAETSVRARIERDDSSSPTTWHVRVQGIPAGAAIGQAALRTADGWRTLSFNEGAAEYALTTSDRPAPTPVGDWGVADRSKQNFYYAQPTTRRFSLGEAFLLPGPDQREFGITKALERGDAVLYLSLTNVPPDVSLASPGGGQSSAPADDIEYRCTQIIRLVVPVSAAAAPETSPAPTAEEPPQ